MSIHFRLKTKVSKSKQCRHHEAILASKKVSWYLHCKGVLTPKVGGCLLNFNRGAVMKMSLENPV